MPTTAIPKRKTPPMPKSLFDTLEQAIVPLYYDVDNRTGVPTGWIRMVKESHSHPRPDVQHGAHVEGIRHRHVRAGGAESARRRLNSTTTL